MKAEVGQNVQAGQLLVSINATDIQAKGGQASAQISQAQANYNMAKKDYERFQNLYKSQSASGFEIKKMDDDGGNCGFTVDFCGSVFYQMGSGKNASFRQQK